MVVFVAEDMKPKVGCVGNINPVFVQEETVVGKGPIRVGFDGDECDLVLRKSVGFIGFTNIIPN